MTIEDPRLYPVIPFPGIVGDQGLSKPKGCLGLATQAKHPQKQQQNLCSVLNSTHANIPEHSMYEEPTIFPCTLKRKCVSDFFA